MEAAERESAAARLALLRSSRANAPPDGALEQHRVTATYSLFIPRLRFSDGAAGLR